MSNELHLIPAIADPNAALILIVIGALGIYAEMNSPGLIAPGVIGSLLVLFGIASLAPDRSTGAAKRSLFSPSGSSLSKRS